MKYIEKKTMAEIPKATGSVSDTLNVEDKITNAPSIRLAEEMMSNNVDFSSELTNFNSKIKTKNVKLLKNGNCYNLFGFIQTSGETSVFTNTETVFKIPADCRREDLPIYNYFFGAANSMGSCAINISGELRFFTNLSNSHWAGFNITWIK